MAIRLAIKPGLKISLLLPGGTRIDPETPVYYKNSKELPLSRKKLEEEFGSKITIEDIDHVPSDEEQKAESTAILDTLAAPPDVDTPDEEKEFGKTSGFDWGPRGSMLKPAVGTGSADTKR